MDLFFVTSRPSTHLAKSGIWGENKIRGSAKNNVLWSTNSLLGNVKRVNKAKPGVALAVVTTNDTKETLVSLV